MKKSGFVIFLLMTASMAMGSGGDNLAVMNRMLEQARPQTVKIVNSLGRPVDVEAMLTRIETLKAQEKKRITGQGTFIFENVKDPVSSFWTQNYAISPRTLTLLEKIILRVNPGESVQVSVNQWPNFISELKPVGMDGVFFDNTTKKGAFSVKVVGTDPGLSAIHPREFVGDPKDLDHQRKLYKKYFLSDQAVEGNDVWQDFIRQPSGVTATKRAEEVIISLTSYPARFSTTWLAIESLLRQQEKPDRIVLNLFEGEFLGRVLLWFIQQQMRRGLEINWNAENLKVYLKVIPTIQKYPDAAVVAVVAVDDDVIYPKDRLKNLLDGYRQHPDCVIASDVRVVGTTGNFILPVTSWHFSGWQPSSPEFAARSDVVPEGVFGILIPPHTFHKDFPRKDLFFSLCPTDDDLWTYAMIVAAGKKVVKIPRNMQPILNVDGTQEIESSLWKVNFANRLEKLSEYFENIYKHYNLTSIFGGKTCATCLFPVKKSLNRSSLTYNQVVPFNQIDKSLSLPADLVSSFGVLEPQGVWTIGKKAQFRIYKPQNSQLIRCYFEASPFRPAPYDQLKFSFKKEQKIGLITSLSFFNPEKKKFGFITEMKQPEEIFEILIENPLSPKECGVGNDTRELGLYISRFGVFEITSRMGTISLGKSFDLSSPINLEDGFHEMEEEGVWSSSKASFSIALPEKAKKYKIDINYDIFVPSENPSLGFRLRNGSVEIFKGISEYGKNQPSFSFTYIPTDNISKFTLEIDQAKSPLELGISEDSRVLGLFLKSINITKV
ncbi:hypothetical protein [Candidatus Finniella inopinata]|uniref:Glycosyltransferase family 2 protein n=1 Tax=Candidatus Finniella inopinata TaxID=1696036 RepID=A0A4Q7DIA6_9PROT|nr:hypothetical protein [Candidatus Finniella inopinata]RZI46080.1 hypothetical protein EQU50_03875 [Candidatus Finniella inopinata]